MPLNKITFKPGINRDQTNYASEGGWYDCDKIRFRSGFPEKIGGWTVLNFNAYDGVCRSMLPFSLSGGVNLIGVATNSKTYVLAGTNLIDITPLRLTLNHSSSPSTDNFFSAGFVGTGFISGTTLEITNVTSGYIDVGTEISGTGIASGTTVVAKNSGDGGTGTYVLNNTQTVSSTTITGLNSYAKVTYTGINASAGDYVTFSGVTSFAGIAANSWNREYKIVSAQDNNSFVISLGDFVGTGSISGTTLTVTSVSSGSVSVNMPITGSGVSANTYIAAFGNGTGGVGTYVVNNSQTVASTTLSNKVTSTTASDGGTNITASFQVYAGDALPVAGYGWGTSTWGRSTWGSSTDTPVFSSARLMFQDRYLDTLYFNYRDETGQEIANAAGTNIYYWAYDSTFTSRASLLTDAIGAVAVPRQVGQILFAPSGHMLALGCTAYDPLAASPNYVGAYDPLLIRWSNVDAYGGPQPQVWQPTSTNTAGDIRVTSGSRIIAGVRTRQEVLVFTDYSLSSLQFTGTQEVFSLQELDNNVSIIGPNAITVANNIVYWMGSNKFYMYSGRVDTLPCTVRQYIFQDINLSLAEFFVCGNNPQFNEVIWFYASADSTDINRYVIYNYLENIWYYGQLSRTYWTDIGYVANPVAVSNGWVYQHENGTDDGQPRGAAMPIEAYIQSADFDIDDGDKFMLIRRIIPDVNFTNSSAQNASAYMTVGVRNFPGAASSAQDANGGTLERNVVTTATIDQYTNQVFVRARGRQMNFKIGSDGVGVQWQLGNPRIDAREDGRRG